MMIKQFAAGRLLYLFSNVFMGAFILLLFSGGALLYAETATDASARVYRIKSLHNPKSKTAALYDVRFKKHHFPMMGNITISYGFTHCSTKDPAYTKRQTLPGTEISYKPKIQDRKTKKIVANESVTLLLSRNKITIRNRVTMLADIECRRHVRVLLGSLFCFLNTHSLAGSAVAAERDGKFKTGMIPARFNRKTPWHMTGWYDSYRICTEKEVLYFQAGKNAQIWIGAAYNNSMEIFSALDAKNPDNRLMILKKGQVFEWSSSITMKNI